MYYFRPTTPKARHSGATVRIDTKAPHSLLPSILPINQSAVVALLLLLNAFLYRLRDVAAEQTDLDRKPHHLDRLHHYDIRDLAMVWSLAPPGQVGKFSDKAGRKTRLGID